MPELQATPFIASVILLLTGVVIPIFRAEHHINRIVPLTISSSLVLKPIAY